MLTEIDFPFGIDCVHGVDSWINMAIQSLLLLETKRTVWERIGLSIQRETYRSVIRCL